MTTDPRTTETRAYEPDGSLTITYTIDDNSDGITDSEVSYTYDTSGRLTKLVDDTNGDGVANYIKTAAYNHDDEGNLTIDWRIDDDADGTIDSQVLYTYDTSGQLIRLADDTNADGIVDILNGERVPLRYEYVIEDGGDSRIDGEIDEISLKVYDESGNLVRESMDLDGNGVVERQTTNTYDDQNRLVLSVSEANGQIETVIEYLFNDEDKSVRESRDYGGDDTIDYIRVSSGGFDDSGSLVSIQTIDSDANGEIDESTTYMPSTLRDDEGNVVEERVSIDEGSDGTIDSISYSAYDKVGNLTGRFFDTDADGNPEPNLSTTYTYNDAGQLISEATGNVYSASYTYNEAGDLISKGVGSLNRVLLYTYAYDEFGNRISEAFDFGIDGSVDGFTTYTYDEAGNLTSETSFGSDDVADTLSTFLYSSDPLDLANKDILTGTTNSETLTGDGGGDILVGLGGDDFLSGNLGDNILIGNQGQDTFVLEAGSSSNIIVDFSSEDLIGLAGGINVSDLSFSGNDVILNGSNEAIATFIGIEANSLQASQFTLI